MTSTHPSIGLFYGSSTCYTEIAAEKIQQQFGDQRVTVHNLADTSISAIADYDFLIFGIPTWDYGELQEDWERVWDEINELDFSGKTVALYGLGDQIGYPEWFQDAMGYLHQVVRNGGGQVVGHWPAQGYQFVESQALTPDKNFFVGLALDEENEFELSEQRIERWCQMLESEFDFD